MPPKPKYTKEEIINAAYGLAREEGIDAVVARAVGSRLGTSSSPIFSVFENMDELKNEVTKKAREYFSGYMRDVFDYTPAFKEYGLRWVRFALTEQNLYSMLFLSKAPEGPYGYYFEGAEDLLDALACEIMKNFCIEKDDAERILREMTVHANGIASFAINRGSSVSEDELSRELSEICIGLVLCARLNNGSFNEPMARAMAQSALYGVMPVKNKE